MRQVRLPHQSRMRNSTGNTVCRFPVDRPQKIRGEKLSRFGQGAERRRQRRLQKARKFGLIPADHLGILRHPASLFPQSGKNPHGDDAGNTNEPGRRIDEPAQLLPRFERELGAQVTSCNKCCVDSHAGFIGSPGMNFLNGRLTTSGGEPVTLIGSHILPLNGHPFKNGFADGEPVILGIRPEKIGPAHTVDAHYRTKLMMDLAEPMGADTLTWFDLDGQGLAARLASQVARRDKRTLELGFDLSTISVFSKDTEQRL